MCICDQIRDNHISQHCTIHICQNILGQLLATVSVLNVCNMMQPNLYLKYNCPYGINIACIKHKSAKPNAKSPYYQPYW